MTDSPIDIRDQGLWRAARGFVAAFASFAGWRAWLATGLVGLGAVLEGAGLVLLIPILGVVVGSGAGGRWRTAIEEALGRAGAETAGERLTLLLAAFAGLMLTRALALYARDIVLASLQARFIETERNAVIRDLAAAPWSGIVALSHARVSGLLSTEMVRVGSSVHFVIQSGVALVVLVIQGALAFALAPGLAALAAALLLAGGGLLALAVGRTRGIGADLSKTTLAMIGGSARLLGGLKSAKAQNAQGRFVAEFEDVQAEMRLHQMAFTHRQTASRLAFATVSALAGAVVVWAGFNRLDIEPAVLVVLVLIFARMSGPAQLIQSAAHQFFVNLPAFEAIRALRADLGSAGAPQVVAVAPPDGPIELRGLRFLHPGGGGLREASLALEPGLFLGLAGSSGAGKTTFVDLLVGLLPPQAGQILVGGEPLDEARTAGWRDSVAYVPQDPFLFHDTLRRNLTWGRPDADEDALLRALHIAGANPVVERLPLGLDTLLGERGTLLSGGERQRIAIAGALLRQPRLLVLDEATNAIDVPAEAALLDRLAALTPRPTIVMIAHRAESLSRCDRIVTIEDGIMNPGSAPSNRRN